jgi:hypothetical protein
MDKKKKKKKTLKLTIFVIIIIEKNPVRRPLVAHAYKSQEAEIGNQPGQIVHYLSI